MNMIPHGTRDHRASIAHRKQHLIEQGALHRAEIARARSQVRLGLQAAPLARNVMHSIVGAAFGMLNGNPGSKFALMRMLSPLIAGGVSALWSKRKGRPLVYAGIFSVVAIVASRLIARKKKPTSGKSGAGG